MRFLALFALAATVALSGCGLPGAPQPPSLGIPKAITDLQAGRKGALVALAWTAPRETTDGELIRNPGEMTVDRAEDGGAFQKIAALPLEPALKSGQPARASVSDNISALLANAGLSDFVRYQVVSLGSRGRVSVPSNVVSVPAVLTASPPQNLTLSLTPDGVSINFMIPQAPNSKRLDSQFIFRIERREKGASDNVSPAIVAQVRSGEQVLPFMDSSIEWEKTYTYWVTPVTLWRAGTQQGEVEGDDSPSSTILTHDIFPPATPSGLEAVFSGMIQHPAIDLTWAPNTEQDLGGYNVYRRTAGSTAAKINTQPVKAPAFHDPNVALGNTYFYSVTAVDLHGNESARSQETSEAVPRE
ncbi:MAG TPA: hypothetical protein VFY05_11340 [Candidatus Angelobacter sp.]|nr:hypothetical protein [Candidatus Angelobacter sp.]